MTKDCYFCPGKETPSTVNRRVEIEIEICIKIGYRYCGIRFGTGMKCRITGTYGNTGTYRNIATYQKTGIGLSDNRDTGKSPTHYTVCAGITVYRFSGI